MLVVTAALQVSEQIKDAGAYAGLASILGLAVLSLLYFGQARELKRLRDWAGRAPERTADLQQQADAAAAVRARRVVAQPAAVPAPMRSPAQTPATAAGAAARPAGPPAAGQAVAPAGALATARPGAAAPAASATAAPGAPAAATPGVAGTPATATPGSRAAPDAAPANGAPPAAPRGQQTQSIPAVDPAPPSAASVRPLTPDVPAAPSSPQPRPPAVASVVAPAPIGPSPPPTDDRPAPLRQVSAATGAPRRRVGAVVAPLLEDERRGPSGRSIGILVGAISALLLVAVLATQVLGGGDDPAPRNSAGTSPTSTGNTFVPPASSGRTDPATPPVAPGDYAVYVLNATQQNGLAAEVAKTLETNGYPTAGTGTAVTSTAMTTQVFFVEGQKRGASAVAKTLDVSAGNVKAVTRGIEVQGPGADVIVQIGADKATP